MSPTAFHLRSYEASTGLDKHEQIQWVFSLHGDMAFEVSGRGGRLSRGRGVFVASGERHDQSAREPNRFLVIECAAGAIDDATHEALLRRPWLAVPDGLIEELMVLARQGTPANALPALLRHYSPDAEYARLHRLCARIEQSPGAPWTVETLAALAGLGVSRLHAVFRAYFGMAPMGWLAACRLRHARHALESSAASLSDIALHLGYSEQSALTRAFRRDVGLPPGAWRRLRQ